MNVTLPPILLRLQQSVHSGGSQHRSNLNVHLEYIWVKKIKGGRAEDPLANKTFMAKHDKNVLLFQYRNPAQFTSVCWSNAFTLW